MVFYKSLDMESTSCLFCKFDEEGQALDRNFIEISLNVDVYTRITFGQLKGTSLHNAHRFLFEEKDQEDFSWYHFENDHAKVYHTIDYVEEKYQFTDPNQRCFTLEFFEAKLTI